MTFVASLVSDQNGSVKTASCTVTREFGYCGVYAGSNGVPRGTVGWFECTLSRFGGNWGCHCNYDLGYGTSALGVPVYHSPGAGGASPFPYPVAIDGDCPSGQYGNITNVGDGDYEDGLTVTVS